jgi:amino acid adenylation domain-containing protein
VTPYLLHHLLERSAVRNPARVAVVDGERRLTYGELDEQSWRLAHLLVDVGVKRGDRIGIYLDKSLEAVVAIYGVLKAGAAYVPFDPRAPVARLAYMARDCGLSVLLSGVDKAESWGGLLSQGAPLETVLALNGEAPELAGTRILTASALTDRPGDPLSVRAIDQDLAYVLYTSGSTGEPKGVTISHRSALVFLEWAVDLLSVGSRDRLSSHAPFHFDLSVFDLFGAAHAGASVAIVPPETAMFPVGIGRFINDHQITVWYSVPSILTMLAVRGGLEEGVFPMLRTIVFAGEVFPTKFLRRLMKLLPHVEFYNWYGPTETNVCTSYRVPLLPEEQDEDIPIGSAIANTDTFVVTDEGRRATRGEVGELYVRGATVMQGYWGDPQRTARVLVEDPFGGEFPDPVYRTGDLVREDEVGNYRFRGRRDAQIKSRGYRIELGEIETALNAHPGVVESAVTAVPDELVTNRIKAFAVVRGLIGKAELVRWCADRIPRYMIPEVFEFVDELPRTSTGKIDRQALSQARR